MEYHQKGIRILPAGMLFDSILCDLHSISVLKKPLGHDQLFRDYVRFSLRADLAWQTCPLHARSGPVNITK